MLSNSFARYRKKMIHERESRSVWQSPSLFHFKKFPGPPSLQQPPPDQWVAIDMEADPLPAPRWRLAVGSDVASVFSNKVFFNEGTYIVLLDIILLHCLDLIDYSRV